VLMEQNGFALDVPFCNETAARAQGQEAVCLDVLAGWLRDVGQGGAEVNWASPVQLVKLLHETLKLPPSPVWKKGRVRIDDGDRKLDETALDWIKQRVAPESRRGLDELIRLRRIRGAIKYLTKLPGYVAPDGLVHAVSGPASDADTRAGTITWRLASKNPEVMQIPTDAKKDWFRVRKAFIAPPNHTLLVADEKALEVVILGHILIKLFDDHQLADMVAPGAPDIHAVNARLVFGRHLKWERHGQRVDLFPPECFSSDEFPELQRLRQDIKAVWYGLMYGKGAYGFATSLRDTEDNPIGEDAASKIIAALYDAVPGVPKYQSFVLDYIQQHHGIPGLGGAWVDLSELTKSGDKWDLSRAHRIAQNYPMQEGGARIIGRAMVDLTADPWLQAQGLKIERQVHDEFDFRVPITSDIPKVKERIRYHMTQYPLASHLQVSIGQGENWDVAGG
jgi:DNA polymerase-1